MVDDNNPLNEFDRKIKKSRENTSIPREELSKLLNRDKRTIVNWESGATLPSVLQLIEMIQVFNVEPGYILEHFIGINKLPSNQELNEIIQKIKTLYNDPDMREDLKKQIELLELKWKQLASQRKRKKVQNDIQEQDRRAGGKGAWR